MARVPSKSDLKKNLRELEQRLAERPLDLDARMRLARTLRLLQRLEDAVAQYSAVARSLSLGGHPLQAIAVLKELLQVAPRHEETLLLLAKLYARTGGGEGAPRRRVAMPVVEAGAPSGAVRLFDADTPLTATSLWRAIAPAAPATIVHSTDPHASVDARTDGPTNVVYAAHEVGARLDEEAAPPRPEPSEPEPSEPGQSEPGQSEPEPSEPGEPHDDLLDQLPPDLGPFDMAQAHAESGEGAAEVPDVDFGDDYEVMGQMTTAELLLPQVPLFSSLSPAAFVELSHAMVFVKAAAGDTLFEEGQPADSCIVISRGRARVSRRNKHTGTDVELMLLGEGDLAGVFALMAAQTRQASLTALTALEYFEIDRQAVDALVDKHPAMRATLARFFRDRLLASLLASLPFFQTLDVRARQALVRRFQDRDYAAGDELFFEGAENDGLWVVLEGRVTMTRERGADERRRAELLPGDYVGSLARIHGMGTDLGAVASSPTTCALLPHKVFSELLDEHDDLAALRERFMAAGLMVGERVFAGNGTLTGHLVGLPTTDPDRA